jgi:hypothetical protein
MELQIPSYEFDYFFQCTNDCFPPHLKYNHQLFQMKTFMTNAKVS